MVSVSSNCFSKNLQSPAKTSLRKGWPTELVQSRLNRSGLPLILLHKNVQLDAEPYPICSLPLYGSHTAVAYCSMGLIEEAYTSDLTSGVPWAGDSF